jgi:hypothetical protein
MLEEATKESARSIVRLIHGSPTPTPTNLQLVASLIEAYGGDMKSPLLFTVASILHEQHPSIHDEFLHAITAVASGRR